MTSRWELEDLGAGRLGIRNANDERSSTKALIRLLDASAPVLSGRTGIPACWSLFRKDELLPVGPPLTSPIPETTFYASVYDTGGFHIGRFKLSDSFMEELHGRHRPANPQVHGGPAGQSSPSARLPALTVATWTKYGADPERSPIENAGIRAGEITGWRTWRVIDGFLHSAYMRHVRWPPRHPLVAAGMTDHENGIYVLNSEQAAYDAACAYQMFDLMVESRVWKYDNWKKSGQVIAFVTGTALLWGDVVEHERGWRASLAKVKSIDSVVFGNVGIDQLRERYGV